MRPFEPTERTQVRRLPERGVYDRDVVYAILDEALICHVGYVIEGQPRVIPTIHARVGDTLYVHGSQGNRTLRALRDESEVCVAATIVDELVLARSGFHHSMNYRSVIVFGRAREVTEPDEKLVAQRAVVDHVVPGRADEIRDPNERELKQTMLLALPLQEASAKVRTGPPHDEPDDYDLPVWAGTLPLHLVPGGPVDDPDLRPGRRPPDNITGYHRPGR